MSVTLGGASFEVQVRSAFEVMAQAYAPYSRFRVGALLVAGDGTEFRGCNVENSSFPAGLCAERAALSAAVASGQQRFSLLVVATEATKATPPCGLCRQALVEFAPDLPVVSVTSGGDRGMWRLSELLPFPFTPDSLTHS